MIQERVNEIFNTELGQQLSEIFVTSDDRVFIRHGEALKHTNGELDDNTLPLVDKSIIEWCPE